MLDAARWAMVVAAASLPFSTALTNLASVLAILAWAFAGQWRATARAVAAEPAAWLGWALFAALLAGTAWSRAPAAEAFTAVNKYRELALFGIVMFLFSDARWRQRLLWASFISAAALLVLSYAVFADLVHFSALDREATQGAVLKRSSITHSFMMSLLGFAAVVAALGLSGWRRWTMAGIALLAAINVLAAIQSRTGYLVLAALALWLAAARWSAKGVAATLLVSLVAVAAAYQWVAPFQSRIDQTVFESDQYEVDPSLTSIGLRRHYLKRSVEWIRDHPLAGAGTGAWGEAFYEATSGDPAFLHNREHRHPHSEYLHLAVQLGLAGMALFIALLVAAFRAAGALPGQQALLARGVVVAFAVGCLFNDFIWDNTEGHIWAVLGGALFGGLAGRKKPVNPPLQ
jgi:O-antigen ligase